MFGFGNELEVSSGLLLLLLLLFAGPDLRLTREASMFEKFGASLTYCSRLLNSTSIFGVCCRENCGMMSTFYRVPKGWVAALEHTLHTGSKHIRRHMPGMYSRDPVCKVCNNDKSWTNNGER